VLQRPPSFDLVVATVGRQDELGRLLESLAAQEADVRVIVVDQNDDGRLDGVLAATPLPIERVYSRRGLSHARNAALPLLKGELVAFPDDDCTYPPGLLTRIAARFADDPALDGLTGRAEDADGHCAASWKRDRAVLTDANLWNRAISFTIFLRRGVVEAVGAFDEELGLGSGTPWSSGEEIDYLVRAIRSGARIEYDPSLVVAHDVGADDADIGARDGASVGYLLRKHRYSPRVLGRMLVRPVGGAGASLLRRDVARSRYHLATLAGRVRGYRGAKRSNTVA
jgi:glycosyltransferase involved in cell wall biosynthesis